jgi:hypothetical protein
MSLNAEQLLNTTPISGTRLSDFVNLDDWCLSAYEEIQASDAHHAENEVPEDNMAGSLNAAIDGLESVSKVDAALEDIISEITSKQNARKINVISNEVVKQARSPTELKKLLSEPTIKKRAKIGVNEEVKSKKKKIVPLLTDEPSTSSLAIQPPPTTPAKIGVNEEVKPKKKKIVPLLTDEPSTSSLAIQPAPTTPMRPPGPVIQADLLTPPPRPLSPIILGSAHKRTASTSESASTPSSQPNWVDEDFTSSQKDAFSSAFAAHRIILGCYKKAESAVRVRERRIRQLESALVAERAALTRETQVARQCYKKLKLVDGTFAFKGGHESSSVV